MSLKEKLFNLAASAFMKLLHLDRANRVSCAFAQIFHPTCQFMHRGKEYIFACPNKLTLWRVKTYFTKEPETIEWIDTFKNNEILFDVGANIGLYSIYAARKGINVIAFEPESQNYGLMNKNLYLNKCANKVLSLNIALSDKDSLDYLYIPDFQEGSAFNSLGEANLANGKDVKQSFKQGVISYSLDSFLQRYPEHFPSHIKVDVDGIEPKVIKGAKNTLRDNRLQSLLIEINESLSGHAELIKIIQGYGFSLVHKRHAQMFEQGLYSKCFNYLFSRIYRECIVKDEK